MTEERIKLVPVNIEAQGIIESMRAARRSEESARAFVTISFPVDSNINLIGILMANIKNKITINFKDVQLPLEERLDPAGNQLSPHSFVAREDDPEKCQFDDYTAGDIIHVMAVDNVVERIIVNGSEADVLRSRRTPADNDEAAEQAMAEAQLASRAKA